MQHGLYFTGPERKTQMDADRSDIFARFSAGQTADERFFQTAIRLRNPKVTEV
jgi:hypothetical protein